MSLGEIISALESHIRPGEDMPEEIFLFISRVTPLVNVDLLIKDDQNRTLLTWRDDEHYGSGWHVPGGIIRYKEHAHERIQRVAEHELGCAVVADSTPALITENLSKERDRGHFISLLYRCRLAGAPSDSLKAGESPQRGQWRWHAGVPDDLLPAHEIYASFL